MESRILGLVLLNLIPCVLTLVAYDCNSEKLNITTISLLEVKPCETEKREVREIPTNIQLIQRAEYADEHVYQCKIEVTRQVTYCGMHSHTSVVRGGLASYILVSGRDQCVNMHEHLKLSLNLRQIIDGLQRNGTISRSVTLAGDISHDGTCTGMDYSDEYGTWNKVVVQADIKITLNDYHAVVLVGDNQIRLRSGVTCSYLNGECVDIEGGETYWRVKEPDYCDTRKYFLLYEGIAQKLIHDEPNGQQHIVYTVTSQQTTFALAVKSEVMVCHRTAWQTEHPKLLIMEGRPNQYIFQRQSTRVENLDLFTYINSKFIYVEKHVARELSSLYNALQTQRCEMERQVIRNLLNLAVISPEEFAYNYMKEPGYTTITAGEVVHIIKCIPVEVKVRHVSECYNELPVAHLNESYFMTPRNHILQSHGSQQGCNSFIAPMYLLNEVWYKLLPSITEGMDPQSLRPQKPTVWKYVSPQLLAASGIYSEKDLENIKNHIMLPSERDAIVTTFARSVSGQPTNLQDLKVHKSFAPDALDAMIKSYTAKLWGYFQWIGEALTGILGILFVYRVIKFITDTTLHGWSLYKMFGFGFHLVGAIWGTVTNIILHTKEFKNETVTVNKGEVSVSSDHITEDNSGMESGPKIKTVINNEPPSPYSEVVLKLNEM